MWLYVALKGKRILQFVRSIQDCRNCLKGVAHHVIRWGQIRRIRSYRNPNSQVRNGSRNFGKRHSVFPQVYRDYSNAELLLSAVPLNARRFREAYGSGTVCNLSHGKLSTGCRVRERVVVVHLVYARQAAPYITDLINAESSPMPRTAAARCCRAPLWQGE